MTATLIRGETASGYNYHLQTSHAALHRLYRGRGHYYIKDGGARTPVYFNEYLFPQFPLIPMKSGTNDYGNKCWEMAHEYRQTEGGASAPYERF
jgi:hypothetical protein